VNPDCVVGFLYIERDHAGVFMKIIATGDTVRDPGKLRDGGVFFYGIRTVRVARDDVG
jgi:hypothetical protein